MATTLAEITYDLSLRSLAQQEASLNELRSRTGVLLAATAIAIALLGAARSTTARELRSTSPALDWPS